MPSFSGYHYSSACSPLKPHLSFDLKLILITKVKVNISIKINLACQHLQRKFRRSIFRACATLRA